LDQSHPSRKAQTGAPKNTRVRQTPQCSPETNPKPSYGPQVGLLVHIQRLCSEAKRSCGMNQHKRNRLCTPPNDTDIKLPRILCVCVCDAELRNYCRGIQHIVQDRAAIRPIHWIPHDGMRTTRVDNHLSSCLIMLRVTGDECISTHHLSGVSQYRRMATISRGATLSRL
jgi:hypothetical protein